MIRTGITSDFNQPFISIDLSSKKYKNRVLSIIETKPPLPGETYYDIRAQWTDAKFHPTMFMDEDDLIELVDELNVWVERIKAERAEQA